MQKRRGGWILRGLLLLGTFSMAFGAFQAGVDVTDRAGVPEAGLLTHVYYALGLFVLGGLDLGLPTGGPPTSRTLLWIAYFVAPLITTSAVVESALRILRPAWLQRRGLRDHVVIVGAGRLGILFLETLRQREPRARILLVDRDAHRANVQLAQDRFSVRFLAGDVRTSATTDSFVLDRARAVALLTDDDLVNLEVAWKIAHQVSRPAVLAHVADIGLRRTVSRVSHSAGRLRVFNSHRIAAECLYREHLEQHFSETAPDDVVVLAGFGRFGQTILEYLQREAANDIQRAVIVDVAAERQVRLFRAQVPGFEACELITVQGDLDDAAVWEQVERATAGLGVDAVYVVATDDERLNLRTAIALRTLHGEAAIYVRAVYESSFTSQLAEDMRFEVLPVDQMLRQALATRQVEWLGELD